MRLTRKQWLRQLGQEAIEDAEDYGETVTRCPTIYKLRCGCGHFATVRLPMDRALPRFRCRRCGSTDVKRVL